MRNQLNRNRGKHADGARRKEHDYDAAPYEPLEPMLIGIVNDHEIARALAEQIARMVLRGTALKLYGWKHH